MKTYTFFSSKTIFTEATALTFPTCITLSWYFIFLLLLSPTFLCCYSPSLSSNVTVKLGHTYLKRIIYSGRQGHQARKQKLISCTEVLVNAPKLLETFIFFKACTKYLLTLAALDTLAVCFICLSSKWFRIYSWWRQQRTGLCPFCLQQHMHSKNEIMFLDIN